MSSNNIFVAVNDLSVYTLSEIEKQSCWSEYDHAKKRDHSHLVPNICNCIYTYNHWVMCAIMQFSYLIRTNIIFFSAIAWINCLTFCDLDETRKYTLLWRSMNAFKLERFRVLHTSISFLVDWRKWFFNSETFIAKRAYKFLLLFFRCMFLNWKFTLIVIQMFWLIRY